MEISIFDFRFSIFDFDSSGFASAVDPWPSGGATPEKIRMPRSEKIHFEGQ
jgi:hypothetical protein